MRFGEMLAYKRGAQGYSQEELAREVHVLPSTIRHLEEAKGQVTVAQGLIERLEDSVNYSFSHLHPLYRDDGTWQWEVFGTSRQPHCPYREGDQCTVRTCPFAGTTDLDCVDAYDLEGWGEVLEELKTRKG